MSRLFHSMPIIGTSISKRKRAAHENSYLLSRRGLERLDLLLLAIESIDIKGGEAMLLESQKLGLEDNFPNRVELWKRRCHNPLRRVTRRGSLNCDDSEALIILLCSMSNRLYPVLHQLLSTNEPISITNERWNVYENRLKDLIAERMNPRRGAVQRLISNDEASPIYRSLILTLALVSGPGGTNRLRASLLDPNP